MALYQPSRWKQMDHRWTISAGYRLTYEGSILGGCSGSMAVHIPHRFGHFRRGGDKPIVISCTPNSRPTVCRIMLPNTQLVPSSRFSSRSASGLKEVQIHCSAKGYAWKGPVMLLRDAVISRQYNSPVDRCPFLMAASRHFFSSVFMICKLGILCINTRI